MAEFETLTVERRGGVDLVTLNRPDVLNAFDDTMREELKSVWRAMRTDDDVRCAVVTGAGDRAFCVGLDRNQPMVATEGSVFGTSNAFMYDDPGDDLGPKACDLWKPVIAAVNGMACGGAFYILSECDIIVASSTATFFDPHVTYGMAAVYEPMKMLQRMTLGDVLRMSLLGAHEVIGAETAERIGLVSEVVAPDDLLDSAMALAEIIASQPAAAVQTTLRAVWAAIEATPTRPCASRPPSSPTARAQQPSPRVRPPSRAASGCSAASADVPASPGAGAVSPGACAVSPGAGALHPLEGVGQHVADQVVGAARGGRRQRFDGVAASRRAGA
jgi:enoyl-CoA hydratase/carnithine racemase